MIVKLIWHSFFPYGIPKVCMSRQPERGQWSLDQSIFSTVRLHALRTKSVRLSCASPLTAAVVRAGSRPLSPRSLARRRPAPGYFASPSRGAGTGHSHGRVWRVRSGSRSLLTAVAQDRQPHLSSTSSRSPAPPRPGFALATSIEDLVTLSDEEGRENARRADMVGSADATVCDRW